MTISEKKWGTSKMKCIDCEKYYVKSSQMGVCIKDNVVIHGEQPACSQHIKRKVDTVTLLKEIAELLLGGQSHVVLLADGAPMFTLSNEMNVNQTDIILRTYCKPGVKYTIVPGDD